LRATVDEFARAQKGQWVKVGEVETDEDRASLQEAREAVAGRSESSRSAIASVIEYPDTMRDFAEQNYARSLRESSRRLVEQLEALIVILRRSLHDSEQLEGLLARKAQPQTRTLGRMAS
jgi:hypothetical protein